MSHVILLGDSVFDNAAYVAGGPDVVAQLRQRLPSGWRASLAAVDGSVISDVRRQIERMATDASHLVVSVGGNDALRHSGVLNASSRSVADSLDKLSDIRDWFEQDYRSMLDEVLRRGLATALCTIYDPRYPNPVQRRLVVTALSVINDCIIRSAVAHGLPLIDLRAVCHEDADFANPIEPSVQGGAKIAGAITDLLSQHDFALGRSEVFVR